MSGKPTIEERFDEGYVVQIRGEGWPHVPLAQAIEIAKEYAAERTAPLVAALRVFLERDGKLVQSNTAPSVPICEWCGHGVESEYGCHYCDARAALAAEKVAAQ